MKLAVLMGAGDIPVGSTVTKRTGEKMYTLEEEVRIFTGDGTQPPKKIKAEGGARFLANGRGDFNVVGPDVELLWRVDANELADWLQEQLEGPDQ